MKLNEIGEFGFIDRLSPLFKDLLKGQQIGIGDDCAVIPMNAEEDLVVSTDMLMEDVHFLRNVILPGQLGYKSVAVNLSDIAAMGAVPIATFLSIAIPAELELEYLDDFMKAYHHISQKYNVPLLGGDTTKSLKHLAINVCVLGKCAKGQARLRSMAKAGDVICLTGGLGDSAGGLQVALNKLNHSIDHDYLLAKHHLPEPRIPEGQFLVSKAAVHAMMDLSDGIASDLKHILKASDKGATIHVELLPISDTLARVCKQQAWDTLELATSGGEDYELLCTVAPDQFDSVSSEFFAKFNKPLIAVGFITEGKPTIKWLNENMELELKTNGFNHFQ